MRGETIEEQTEGEVLDLRAVFGVVAHVTTPAKTTGGAYVEMDITADPGAKTMVHIHPEMDETYQVLSGTLDVFYDGRWRSLDPESRFPSQEVRSMPFGTRPISRRAL